MISSFKVFSHYSIQRAYAHVPMLVKKAHELGLKYLVLSDYESLAGSMELMDEIDKNKYDIVPICGTTIQTDGGEVTLLAKNLAGWIRLSQILSSIHRDPATIHDGSLGKRHVTDAITNAMCDDLVAVTDGDDAQYNYLVKYIPGILRSNDQPVLYANAEDKIYCELQVCSRLGITLVDGPANTEAAPIFKNDYSLKPISNSVLTPHLSSFSKYSLKNKPSIPKYKRLPPNTTSTEYLKQLCREGWRKKIEPKIKDNELLKKDYVDRIKDELSLLASASLEDYMLNVYEFVNYCRSNGSTATLRGSAAGCLVFYLLDVVTLDPVWPDSSLPYDPHRSLVFARFINKGRFAGGKFQMPDADLDIPGYIRDALKDHIRSLYTEANVANIMTFQKMKGKAAIREVFRIFGLSLDVADNITKYMVDEAKVQDELQDIKEVRPDYTIINYNIDHIGKVEEYYKQYTKEFNLAIGLCNTIRSIGIHAAGILVANEPIANICPLRYNEENNCYVAAMKMQDVETRGLTKFDLLSVEALAKISELVKEINGKGI